MSKLFGPVTVTSSSGPSSLADAPGAGWRRAEVSGRETTRMAKRRPPFEEGPYLVVGLARSGQAAARLLAKRAEGVGCDSAAPAGAAELADAGVEVHLDTDGVGLIARSRCLVKSPGVPREAPVVVAATRRRIPVVGELELAWRLLSNRFVAVTGTNGKTTAT